jgi:hypothetical protein
VQDKAGFDLKLACTQHKVANPRCYKNDESTPFIPERGQEEPECLEKQWHAGHLGSLCRHAQWVIVAFTGSMQEPVKCRIVTSVMRNYGQLRYITELTTHGYKQINED